jgi:polyhydroxybutyrate depolymerase
MRKVLAISVLSVLIVMGGSSVTSAAAPSGTATESVDSRPFTIVVPKSYRASTPAPLIVALHGYTSSGKQAQEFFGLGTQAEKRGFIAVYPDGTKDGSSQPFWNATNACCNFGQLKVDDSAYLIKVIDKVASRYNVDPKRVYFMGHSNGGFMSYRMACEHADRVAAIVSVAGETYADGAACKPSQPVSVAQVQGSTDETISYTGGSIFGNAYPGAEATVKTWAGYNGCGSTRSASAGSLDLVAGLAGKETTVATYAGCKSKSGVELWTIKNGRHSPVFTKDFAASAVEFLLAHPKL